MLIVADDETALSSQVTDFTEEKLEAAGVVAITGPRGYGTTRILTELQNVWLLGFGDVIIISPVGVRVGNFIHSELKVAVLFLGLLRLRLLQIKY